MAAELIPAWQQLQSEAAELGVSLPQDAMTTAGMAHNRHWTVYWLPQAALRAMDFLAEHRHGQVRHLRFTAEGQRIALPAPADPYANQEQALWAELTTKFAPCRAEQTDDLRKGDAGIEQPAQIFSEQEYRDFLQQSSATRSQRGAYQLGYDRVPASLNRQAFDAEPAYYRARLPRYRLAVCPFCYQPVTEAVDTFSLNGPGWWRCEPSGLGWFGAPFASTDTSGSYLVLPQTDEPSVQGCGCLLAVDYGVNLQGQVPQDVRQNWVWLGSPRPGLRPALLADAQVEVVMRTLPIASAGEQPYILWLACYFRRGGGGGMVRLPPDAHYHYQLADLGQRLWFLRGHIIEPHDHAGITSLGGEEGRWCIWNRQARNLPPGETGRALLKLRWPVV